MPVSDFEIIIGSDSSITVKFTVPGENSLPIATKLYAIIDSGQPYEIYNQVHSAGDKFSMNFGKSNTTDVKVAVICYYQGDTVELVYDWHTVNFNN